MSNIKKIETIYSQGTAEDQEDGLCVNLPLVGVIDGLSAPFHHEMERPLFNGMSGGQMVRQEILKALYSANNDETLEKILLHANKQVGIIQSERGIPLDRADLLAGACIAVARLSQNNIDIIQAGDCFAIWITNKGRIGFTKNQASLHEIEIRETWRIIQQTEGIQDRRETWVKFHEPLSSLRLRDINQINQSTGYGLLNGQALFEKCWQKLTIPLENLKLLILFSDGLLPLRLDPGNEKFLAKEMIALYKQRSLKGILEETRNFEKKEKERHIEHGEATAIAIEFEE